MIIRVIFLTAVTIMLSACATTSPLQCAQINWYSLGEQFGTQGKSVREVDAYKSACKKENLSADIEKYLDGYVKGIMTFCTHDNGVSLGSNGFAYPGVCPTEVEDKFLKGYKKGLLVFKQKQNFAKQIEYQNQLRSSTHGFENGPRISK